MLTFSSSTKSSFTISSTGLGFELSHSALYLCMNERKWTEYRMVNSLCLFARVALSPFVGKLCSRSNSRSFFSEKRLYGNFGSFFLVSVLENEFL